ncbi:hypothetical protein [Parvularcula dongshanensis]|uniref:Glycosyl transferase family 2 n=1 Tax=Parvularcula dongshanensis TaxID=1173995 RepID=A0A840I465_9PROT|nr:hypothetical protein [Parvularcula dongshanensis]MBB4659125.1 hypothetical protein [Parvularcula dongshanensis]
MTDRPHGLKDLFGSIPDSKNEAPRPASDMRSPSTTSGTDEGHSPSGRGAPGAPVIDIPGGPAPDLPTMPDPAPGTLTAGGSAAQGTAPLSVVLVALRGWSSVRRTVEALGLQTEAAMIDLLLVSPGPLDGQLPTGALRSVSVVSVPDDAGYAEAAAAGLRAAQGDLIALLDDYAFPAVDWAEAVISHRLARFGALGSAYVNANPRSPHSWSHMLIEYGRWRDGLAGGEVDALPSRNLVFRRDVLASMQDDLAALLSHDGALIERLRRQNLPLLMDDGARVGILNPSTMKGALGARFAAGRLAAAQESRSIGLPKRTAKAVGSLLGAHRNYRRSRGSIFAGSDPTVNPKRHGRAVMLGILSEGAGRAAGYLRGAGKAAENRARLDTDRTALLNKTDRRQFGPDKPKRR